MHEEARGATPTSLLWYYEHTVGSSLAIKSGLDHYY